MKILTKKDILFPAKQKFFITYNDMVRPTGAKYFIHDFYFGKLYKKCVRNKKSKRNLKCPTDVLNFYLLSRYFDDHHVRLYDIIDTLPYAIYTNNLDLIYKKLSSTDRQYLKLNSQYIGP